MKRTIELLRKEIETEKELIRTTLEKVAEVMQEAELKAEAAIRNANHAVEESKVLKWQVRLGQPQTNN